MRTLASLLALLIVAAACVLAGHAGLRRVEEASALSCARASDGTDSAICDCYARYGLDVPEDMQ